MNRRSFLFRTCAAASIATAQSRSDGVATIGDERLRIVIEWGERGLFEKAYIVNGEPIAGLSGGDAWSLELDDGRVSSTGSDCTLSGSTFEGRTRNLHWQVEYRTTGPGRITKVLRILPRTGTRMRSAVLWIGNCTAKPRIGRTKIQEFAAFYRDGDHGLFVSPDFPYSRIWESGPVTSAGYRPFDPLPGGEWYECHSITLGATRLKDRAPAVFDPGEIDAFDDYIQNHRRPRFERPMNVYASIVNRYTQVHGDTVFYTMKDQPTLAFNTDLVERDLALMTKLGMEYYQVFPGAFEWPANDARPEVDRLVRIARDRGLRIGDYSAATRVYSPHFNIGNNRLSHPEWLVQNERGEAVRDTYCFGNAGFERYYTDTVVSNCRRYGFEMHCLDMLRLVPCYAPSHGHPAGTDSLYHQVRGLLRMIASVNAVAPQMMTWPNSGDWLEILPKLAWYSPNLYLTDPFIATRWQGLNMTRLLDDSRREQMVSLHHEVLLPYRFFTNCQYFFSQNSVVPDIRNFEYGALSTLAVTPNLCLGEFRPWVDSLSPSDQQRVFGFYQRWTRFVADHYQLWKHTFEGGERPGFGAVEVYSHAAGDRGFVFLVNPNYWDREYEIALDPTLGFTATGRCEIAELYPVERLWLTAQGPWPRFGTRLPVRIPAQSVIALEIRPAPASVERPSLYGLPGTVEPTGRGYRAKTRGPQGRTARFAVMFPPGVQTVRSVSVVDYGNELDPRLWAPTPVKLLSSGRDGALIEVTFRREAAPRHLTDWKARPASLKDGIVSGWKTGLPPAESVRFPVFVDAGIRMPLSPADGNRQGLGPAANFCGAYIEHAFSEDQETWIDLDAAEMPSSAPLSFAPTRDSRPPRSVTSVAGRKENGWWFETTVHVPFLYQVGAEPSPSGHTLIVLPFFRVQQLQDLRLWINGREAAVQYYAYPRNRKLGCHSADLVGSAAHGGENQIVVFCSFDTNLS